MLPILHIGPLALQFPGLILLLGLWLGSSLMEKMLSDHLQRYAQGPQQSKDASYQNLTASVLSNLLIGSLLAALIGARLLYILQYTRAFSENPLSILSLNVALFDVRGAILGAIIFALAFIQRKNLHLWHTLDTLTPGLAVLAIAFHLSNLASGSGFGAVVEAPWGIELWGAIRRPVQLYEALTAAGILLWLWQSRTKLSLSQPGIYFLIFLAYSSASRLFWEAFHGDSPLLFGGIRTVQVFAWIVLGVCLWEMRRINSNQEAPLTKDQL